MFKIKQVFKVFFIYNLEDNAEEINISKMNNKIRKISKNN